jgi:hypothetical protein
MWIAGFLGLADHLAQKPRKLVIHYSSLSFEVHNLLCLFFVIILNKVMVLYENWYEQQVSRDHSVSVPF